MKRLDEITIADLMPDSISKDAQVSATARAIDPQLRLISEAIDRPLILPAIDDLSAGVLEHLAVQYDVTAWDSAWPIETKRAVLKTAIADKRKKGTRGAVERAIEAVAPIATLTEWWQDLSGEMLPHTFKIDLLQDEAVDPETQANVIAQVDDSKPVRSHYTLTAIQKAGSGLYFAGVLRAIAYARVRSAGITIEQTEVRTGVLATLRGMSTRRILASSHMGDMPEPEPPEPPIVDTSDYYILDATTGAVLHSVNSPLSSAKPSAVTITGNIEHIDNPPAEYIDVILAMKYNTSPGQFVANSSSADDWWWSCVRNQEDKDRLTAFGVRVEDPRSSGSGISTRFCGPYGCINDSASDPLFSYEVLGVYSDIDGTTPISQDVSNFYTGRSATWPEVILIWNIAATPSYMTWKCRITKLSQ